jgi:hypothetical protein
MCEDFTPNFGDKRTGCCITTTHFLTLPYHREIFFTENNMDCLPHPPYCSLSPRLKMKLKGRHFDIIERIEAKSQAVLNIITEHNLQDARSNGNGAYARKGRIPMVMVASRPKASEWSDGSSSPRNYGWLRTCLASRTITDIHFRIVCRYVCPGLARTVLVFFSAVRGCKNVRGLRIL